MNWTFKEDMSPFARDLYDSMRQGLDYLKHGGPAVVSEFAVPDPPPPLSKQAVQSIRKRQGMTQSQFARLLNVSAKTVEYWEQGIRRPSGMALRLLQIVGQSATPPPARESPRRAAAARDRHA